MRLSLPTTLGVLASLLGISIAHNIQLGAHSRECFHEQLHADDKMTVSFQVGDREFGGSGNLEVDFWVSALHLSFRQAVKTMGRSVARELEGTRIMGRTGKRIALRGLGLM